MKPMDSPKISILLPIRNEQEYIADCLRAILNQDCPYELEILIADGESSDNTLPIIQSLSSETGIPLSIFSNPKKIVSTGLNILIPKAIGEIIIRVDGHCVIEPDYVANCVRHLQQNGVDAVGGPMRSVGEDFTSQGIALAMSSRFGVGNSSFRTESGKTKLVDTVPFPAYTHEIIQRVGLYDEELVRNQDDEYNYRIREHGGRILLAEDVRSTYFSRGSLAKLWMQYFQYGYWKVRVLQKHPKQMSLRQFVPLVFVLSLLLSLVFTLVVSWGWIPLVAILGLYLLVNLSVSMLYGYNHGWQFLSLLPATFAVIHLSYGTGFLTGLFKFFNRWGDKIGKVPFLKEKPQTQSNI